MIVDLYNSGKSYTDLYNEYGVPQSTARQQVDNSKDLSETLDNITLQEFKRLKKELNSIKEENEILKKPIIIFAKKISSNSIIFNFIDKNKSVYSVNKLCNTLNIPKSSYYEKKSRTISKTTSRRIKLTNLIKNIFFNSKKRYGASKIHNEL